MMGQRIVKITTELFTHILTEGWSIGDDSYSIHCIEGLPEGAILMGVYPAGCSYNSSKGVSEITLKFEHSDWPKLLEGEVPPEICVTWERRLIEDA